MVLLLYNTISIEIIQTVYAACMSIEFTFSIVLSYLYWQKKDIMEIDHVIRGGMKYWSGHGACCEIVEFFSQLKLEIIFRFFIRINFINLVKINMVDARGPLFKLEIHKSLCHLFFPFLL